MDKQREMFEAWYGKYCDPGFADWFKRDAFDGDEYDMSHTQTAWDAWQAAIAAQWHQIETAPKDGQVCVVYYPDNETLRVWPAQYDAENKSFTAGSHSAAGWFEYGEVTHWMQLPPEPTK